MTESFKEERSHNEPRYKSAVKKDGVTCTTTINDSDLLGWVYAQSVKIPWEIHLFVGKNISDWKHQQVT